MAARNADVSWIESLIDKRERGSDGKEHWILKTNVKKRVEASRIQVLTIGQRNKKPVKTVLLLGQTGSGKSLLLNGFVNHIFNIKYDSPFRLKLRDQIVGHKRDHTQSQTDYVTAFLIYHQEGMLYVDYNLLIIDTPGFDGMRGTDMITNLHDFFMSDFGINCLNCIGLVMKGNENRSLTYQKELVNAIISLLGKDCSNITRLLCTFAYFGTPVVDVVRDAGIEVAGVDRFENFPLCPLLGQNTDADCLDPSALWENMSKGYCKFFEALPNAASVNVKKSRELLKKLKELDELKDKLRGITVSLSSLSKEVEKHCNHLSKLLSEFYQLCLDADETCYKLVGKGRHAHNCLKCGQCCFTCNDPSNNRLLNQVLEFAGCIAPFALKKCLSLVQYGDIFDTAIVHVVGKITKCLVDKMSSTKEDCPNICSNDGCKHAPDDHAISLEEMVPKWSIGGNVTREQKRRCEELKKGIQEASKAREKCSKALDKKGTEAKKELERLISVTENISELSSGSDTPTPDKILKELDNESLCGFSSEVYSLLRDCLSEIKGNGEAKKETSKKRNLTQCAQDNKKFKKE